ncbi:hypothetical protein LTR62_000463 [Meristemomyces frigidus]|uniref:Uncharacterized protein n=1 Tax=Meristemomyces frigidus TaxID=1508187 RepID=A0AAN7TUG0_9PEZI|nr:hypothetical protein LTR62_000463 [Meristemomyces frigidus]
MSRHMPGDGILTTGLGTTPSTHTPHVPTSSSNSSRIIDSMYSAPDLAKYTHGGMEQTVIGGANRALGIQSTVPRERGDWDELFSECRKKELVEPSGRVATNPTLLHKRSASVVTL